MSAGLSLSRLAFGCAPVMGRVSRAVALRAMHTAFERGVTHFDVARSYGYGDAEAVLGEFAAGRRDRITIATKFGIRASGTARGLRWLKPAIRQIANHLPYARAALHSVSGKSLSAGHYELAEARRSFEHSLKQLKTDYADILFIHDCSPADELSGELLDYLQNLVRTGHIRAWGIATRPDWIAPVCAKLLVQPMIIQCAQDILHAARTAAHRNGAMPAIFHSPFAATGAIEELRRLLGRESLPQPLIDIAPRLASPDGIARLLIEGALFLAGAHPVLCSMFRPSHILANFEAMERPWFTPTQLAALAAATIPASAGATP